MLAEDPELVAKAVALLVVDLWIRCWPGSGIGRRGWRPKTGAANVKIFLEAIELQEVGEFECADISALCTYFFLEIGEHAFQVCSTEAGTEELVPESLPVKAQG